jgi:hypothetical protein
VAGSVAAAVARFVSAEVADVSNGVFGAWRFATGGRWAVVSVMGIEAVIDATVEVFGAVIPRACADEDSVNEPCWAVVAPGSAGVRRVVVITVGTDRSGPDLDGDLRLCCRWACDEADSNNGGDDRKTFESVHGFSPWIRRGS